MLEVELNIIYPAGHKGCPWKNIGTLKIVNMGSRHDSAGGDYGDYICHHENGSFWVCHHRPDGAWVLVRKCIEGLLGEEETR